MSDRANPRRSSTSALALASFLVIAGAAHFVAPEPYRRIVPRAFGNPAFWVRWSGVAEIGCAALLAYPRTRRIGGCATVVLLAAVFPANVRMALDGGIPGASFPLGSASAAWARLPLQFVLVGWAVAVARSARAPFGRRATRRPARFGRMTPL